MSEPQPKSTLEVNPTSPSEQEFNRGEEPTAPAVVTDTPVVDQQQQPELSGPVKTLKDAFPDLDVEVIETILDSQGGNLDAAFEILLGMSDPTYKPSPSEIAQQSEGLNQLRQDEEYARRLAREGDAHYPQNNTTEENQQPLFNFQEELPIIKEKVIEVGTAAKNKIMNLYNQFMAGPTDQSESSRGSGVLESGMGNLSLSDNQPPRQPPRQQQRPTVAPQERPVDLYEWDGQGEAPGLNPLLTPRKDSVTSTPTEQMLSDEEFARQLAREDAEAAETAAAIAAVQRATGSPNTTTTAPLKATEEHNEHIDSGNGKVTFSALHDNSSSPAKDTTNITNTSTAVTSAAKTSGYTIHDDDDDLDDLFDKQDSTHDLNELKIEDEETKLPATKK